MNQILYEATVGQDLVLNCAIDANPQPRFKWFFENNQINTFAKSVSLDELTGQLTVENVTLSNEGTDPRTQNLKPIHFSCICTSPKILDKANTHVMHIIHMVFLSHQWM